MKISGVQVTNSQALLVLPRDSGNIPIHAIAVSISDEFNDKCPVPVAPMVMTKAGNNPDYSDKDYKVAMKRRDDMRFALMCIASLAPSNIEWDKVDRDKPPTWLKWREELQTEGISEVECNRIVGLVLEANALDETKIKDARADFLLGQGA
jgi:hypothetical protein